MSHQLGGVNRPARTTGSALGATTWGDTQPPSGGQTKGVLNATDLDHVAPSHRRRPRGPRVPDSRDGLQLLLERRRRERRVRGRLHRGLGCGFRSERSRSGASTSAVPTGKTVGVSLILKTLTNPYFVSMKKDAEAAAKKDNVKLTRRRRQAGR